MVSLTDTAPSDFDSQDIADAVAVANVGGAARRK